MTISEYHCKAYKKMKEGLKIPMYSCNTALKQCVGSLISSYLQNDVSVVDDALDSLPDGKKIALLTIDDLGSKTMELTGKLCAGQIREVINAALREALNQLSESAVPNTYIEYVESAETVAYAEEE